MTRDEIISRLIEIIADTCPEDDLELSNVDPAVPLRDQLGLDSVAFLEIVMELRMRYGIDVPEEDYMELTTLDRCVAYLGPKFESVG